MRTTSKEMIQRDKINTNNFYHKNNNICLFILILAVLTIINSLKKRVEKLMGIIWIQH